MLDVLAVVQVAALLLLLAPLVIVAACALRRSGRKIDQILAEELGPDTSVGKARPRPSTHAVRPATRPARKSPAR